MILKGNIKSSSLSKTIFFGTCIFLFLVLIASMPRVSFPLFFAFVLSLIFKPVVPSLRKFGIPKTLSIIIVFIVFGFLFIYPILKIGPTIQKESENFQFYVPKIEKLLNENYAKLRNNASEKLGVDLPEDIVNKGILVVQNEIGDILLQAPNLLASILEWLLLVPLFLFFLLKDGNKIKRGFLKLVPNSIFERAYNLVYQFNLQIGDYIFAKFVEASIVGLIITCGLLIIDVRFAFLLGIVAGVTNIIPYIGPFLGMIPGLILCFLDFGISPTLGAVFILYMVANIIDLAFVFPILVSKIVDLHPVLVVVSVIIGSQYLGIVGMIISIPLAASLKLIVREIYKNVYPDTSRGSL